MQEFKPVGLPLKGKKLFVRKLLGFYPEALHLIED